MIEPRQIDPAGQRTIANGLGAHLANQLPSPGEVAGEKQREQEPNRFDWLHRPKVDLGVARSRTAAKDEQDDGQRQGADERQVTQLAE